MNIEGALVIIGIVNGFRLLKEGMDSSPKTYWGFAFFVLALFAGIVLGALHFFGLTIQSGIIVALSSSGLYRAAEKVGNQ